ncbi:MAG: pentapeptide repeat-containing protein, partial [Actinomyces graevenitzii]|nr:pentapeptide repeat-containing protein [Actinomyces graevenitzii]
MYERPTVNKELLEVAATEVKLLLDQIADDGELLVLAVNNPDSFSDSLRKLAYARRLDIEQEAEPYFNELVDVVEKQYVKVAPRSSEFGKAALKNLVASKEQVLTITNQNYELSEDTNKEVKNSNAKLDDVKKDVNDIRDKVVAEIKLLSSAKGSVISEEVAEALSKRSKRLTFNPAIQLVDAHAVVGVFEEPRKGDAPSNVNRAADTPHAVERLVSWACGSDDEHSPMCALLGDLGTGKTTTTVLATQRLLELRKAGEQVPLPIYFDLRDLSLTALKDFGMRTLLTQLLAKASLSNVTVDNILTTIQDEHTLVIFDGLDEILVHLTPGDGQRLTRSLLEVLDLDDRGSQEENPRTRMLLSCRTQYFRTVEEEFSFFDGQGRENKRGKDYLVLTLLPFNEDQIREYLRRNVPEADINQLMETICSVHNLRELASQPVLLDMIRQVLLTIDEDLSAGHEVRSVDLYERFVNKWLRRDDGKHSLIPDHKIQLMTHLAWQVWRSGSRTWSARWMETWMLQFLHTHPDMELHYQGRMPDQWKQDFRTATFLTRRGDDFSFAHSSLLEYFLAVRLADSLEAESEDEALAAWDITRPSDEAFAFFAELIDRFSATAQQQRLARLTRVGRHANPNARANVFAYTLRALDKGAPHPRPDALNLADTDLRGWTIGSEKTPLNLTGVSLRGACLDDARIRRARLDGIDATAASMRRTLLEHCTLSDANLEEADLAGTVFRHCDLDGASLDKATRYRTQLLHTKGYRRELPDILTAPLTEDTPLRVLPEAQILGGHSGYVTAVAWSPDGHHILTASNDGTARIWDATTGDNTLTLTHTNSLSVVAWSPDGHHILTGSEDGTVRIWDAATGDNTLTLTHKASVTAVAWSPDARHILTVSRDRTVRIWDATTGDNTLTLTHTDPVTAVAWSP